MWSEFSEKNRAHQKRIFEVNQKRDLTSFKHFTAPKIKTPGTYLIFLGVSHQQKKNQEHYFLELDDILVDIELVFFRRSKVPIYQPVPKNILRKIKILKSHSRWKKFQFWIFFRDFISLRISLDEQKWRIFFEKVKWSASSRWSSSQYCQRRNSDQITTENTHPTLQ